MWGQSERILPLTAYNFFRRHLPGHARVQEPEGFGHSPFLERPNELARRILAFMTEVGSHETQEVWTTV
jgi:pimeloyl-ACP methyl ester carboxylesterase